jgi:hypothetical protein
MTLEGVKSGKLDIPIRALLYGVEKIGKSTFASEAPNPIFLCPDDGATELAISRFPEPTSWQDVLDACNTLLREEHAYKTFVLDTVDWVAPLVHKHVIDNALPDKQGIRPRSIDEVGGGYGKGTNAAIDVWRILLAKLSEIRTKRNMHIVLLGHAVVKAFKNPEGDDYDRYELKMSRGEAGLLKEWCDAVLFAKHELFTVEKKRKVRGISDGARYMYTQWCPAYDAGNRYNLPDKMPLDWAAFWEAKVLGQSAVPADIEQEIYSTVGDDKALVERAQKAIGLCAGDPAKLARLLNKVRTEVQGE